MDNWISCDERMPGDYQDVIVTDGRTSHFAYWDVVDQYWLYPGNDPIGEPILWQPLPSPPTLTVEVNNKGWIEWQGGECPVDRNSQVDVKFSGPCGGIGRAGSLFWSHDGGNSDIIAYRVIENDGR